MNVLCVWFYLRTEKLLKLEKRHPKIQIFFSDNHIWRRSSLIKKHKKSRIILIINHHHKRHPLRRRLKITFSKTPPPTLFLISHQVRSNFYPDPTPRATTQSKWFLLFLLISWKLKSRVLFSPKTCGSLWFGRNTTQII